MPCPNVPKSAMSHPESSVDHPNGNKCTGFGPKATSKRWAEETNLHPLQDKVEKLNKLNAFPPCPSKSNTSKAAGMMTEGCKGSSVSW